MSNRRGMKKKKKKKMRRRDASICTVPLLACEYPIIWHLPEDERSERTFFVSTRTSTWEAATAKDWPLIIIITYIN